MNSISVPSHFGKRRKNADLWRGAACAVPAQLDCRTNHCSRSGRDGPCHNRSNANPITPLHASPLALITALLLCGLVLPLLGQETRNVLILGDSLADGSGVNRSQAFPSLLQEKIDSAKLPFKIINAGVSGDTSAGGLRRIDWLLRRKTDVLLLELGGNDGLRGMSPELTRSNLQGIIDKAKKKQPDIRIVIAGMQMPENMGKDYAEKFKKVFPDLAKANNCALIPFLLEGIGADPRYNLPDLIHPNPEGHKIVASTIWKTLEPTLRSFEKAD